MVTEVKSIVHPAKVQACPYVNRFKIYREDKAKVATITHEIYVDSWVF